MLFGMIKKILLQFKEMHLSKKEKNSMRIKFKNDHKKKTENFINKLHDYLPEKKLRLVGINLFFQNPFLI